MYTQIPDDWEWDETIVVDRESKTDEDRIEIAYTLFYSATIRDYAPLFLLQPRRFCCCSFIPRFHSTIIIILRTNTPNVHAILNSMWR